MSEPTAVLFARAGLGSGPADLQLRLAAKYLEMVLESGQCPWWLLFYTEGVRLACHGSPVLEQLRDLEALGVTLILCRTCLEYFGLVDQVAVGTVGGMPAIIEAMQQAGKVVSLLEGVADRRRRRLPALVVSLEAQESCPSPRSRCAATRGIGTPRSLARCSGWGAGDRSWKCGAVGWRRVNRDSRWPWRAATASRSSTTRWQTRGSPVCRPPPAPTAPDRGLSPGL